jgi:hypothetical protein
LELLRHRVDGGVLFVIPGKDLTHHGRFFLMDLDPAVPAVPLGVPSVAIRQFAGPEFAHSGPVESSAAGAFQNLCPFVLGDRALDLKQELIVRGVADGPFTEVDVHPRTVQLFEQQDLIGILASQAIRTEHHDHVEPALPSVIAKLVEGRALQVTPAPAVVGIGEGRRGAEAVLLSIVLDGGQLAADRLLFLLHVGGNASVEGRLKHSRLLAQGP